MTINLKTLRESNKKKNGEKKKKNGHHFDKTIFKWQNHTVYRP